VIIVALTIEALAGLDRSSATSGAVVAVGPAGWFDPICDPLQKHAPQREKEQGDTQCVTIKAVFAFLTSPSS